MTAASDAPDRLPRRIRRVSFEGNDGPRGGGPVRHLPPWSQHLQTVAGDAELPAPHRADPFGIPGGLDLGTPLAAFDSLHSLKS